MWKKVIILIVVVAGVFSQKQSRIVGGIDVKDGEYLYQVSIRNRGVHDCGGAIIDEYWILTAAHCLTSRLPRKMSVVVGTIYLDHGGEEYNVSKIIPHPQFSKITLRDDIGLLKVDRPFVFGAKVQPIKLPTHDIDSGVKLMLTGWGQLDVEEDMPNKLQKLELESISHFRCILSHGALKIWLTNVCTFTKAGEGACYGDSGSPLVHDGQVMGIISWSKPCATGRPDVSTRVYYYISWILDNKH